MQIIRLFFLFFLFIGSIQADWNRDFDEKSGALAEHLPYFQNPTYLQWYEFFKKARESLIHDGGLTLKVERVPLNKKLMFFKNEENLVIKKRRNHHIYDAFAWELSFLLGSTDFLIPSFPVEIGGKRVIIQKMEPFKYNLKESHDSQKIIHKVSLEPYWKAHIQAYLLGLSDLASRNIGVSAEGKLRFFDNEASFIYYNEPKKTSLSFTTGFISESFDWSQYRVPLDERTAENLRNFVRSFAHFEEHLKIYQLYRPLSFSEEELFFRLEKVRSFPIEQGKSFRDFYGFVFPRMSSGLDELNHIVRKILEKKVDHGSTLFFVCRRMKNFKLSHEQKAAIQKWVNTYID